MNLYNYSFIDVYKAQDEGPAEPAALPLGADLFARHLAAIGGAAKLRAVRTNDLGIAY